MTSDDWLEGGTADDTTSVPVRMLDKHAFSRATGYPLKAIDRLIREGLPTLPGRSKRDGLRFPSLPGAIEWIAEQRATERAGPDDESTAGAKRRLALAKARQAELENAQREGELIEVEHVHRWIRLVANAERERLVGITATIPNLTAEQREAIDTEINAALTDFSTDGWLESTSEAVRAFYTSLDGEGSESS